MTFPTAQAVGRRVIDLEAEALSVLSASLGATFDTVIEVLLGLKGSLVISGMGKSGHIGRKMAATLSSTGTRAIFIHPGEASHGDLGIVGPQDIVIALSRSGETSELGDMIAHAKMLSIPLIAITAEKDSTLAKTTKYALILPDVAEACAVTRAPTTSTIMMAALGDAIAVALLERKNFTQEDFKRFHPGGNLGAMLSTVSDLMHTGDALPLVALGTSLDRALEVMGQKKLGCVGIIHRDDTLAGILTDGDVRRVLARNEASMPLEEVMTTAPFILPPHTRALEAVAMLNTREISQVFIVESSRPVGIVHMHDFLRAQIG